MVSAKQRHSTGESLFPLVVALSGLPPLKKVWVDYEPKPKNIFLIRVNDADIHNLVKEELEFDPTKTEKISVKLTVNEKVTIAGSVPWIINDVEEKI